MPNLRVFGATEFMDSAISPGVLSELILRGLPYSGPSARGRGASQREDEEEEMDDSERRADYKPLEALDFCGCVSSVFVASLQQFVEDEGLGLDYAPVSQSALSPVSPVIEHVEESS